MVNIKDIPELEKYLAGIEEGPGKETYDSGLYRPRSWTYVGCRCQEVSHRRWLGT